MGKLLRALVVIIFLESIGALVLGVMLFGRREVLKGRTQKLEKYMQALAPTIEDEAPEPPLEKPAYPARDVAECTAQVLQTPETSPFWATYRHELEEMADKRLNLTTPDHVAKLMNYYKRNAMGEIERDPTTGLRVTTGENTMDSLLTMVLEKASMQYDRLNDTRSELRKTRGELVETIADLNRRKNTLRDRLAHIVELNNSIAQLQGEIRSLKGTIAQLEEEIQRQKDTIADQRNQIAKLEDEKATFLHQISELNKKLKEVTTPVGQRDIKDFTGGVFIPLIQPGHKGTVVSVNTNFNFCVVSLLDDFVTEVFRDPRANEGQGISPIFLNLLRGDRAGGFVTKVRLMKIQREQRLGVADILPDWQQAGVRVGDLAWF